MKQDQIIICKDCNSEFLFVIRDQEFFKEHGWQPPIRCRKCQQLRKERYGNRTKQPSTIQSGYGEN